MEVRDENASFISINNMQQQHPQFCDTIVSCLKHMTLNGEMCSLCKRTIFVMSIKQPWTRAIFRHGKVFENRTTPIRNIHTLPLLALIVSSRAKPTGYMKKDFQQKTGVEFNPTHALYGTLLGAVCFDKVLTLGDQCEMTDPDAAKWIEGPYLWHISEKVEFDIPLPDVQGCQTPLRYLQFHPQQMEIFHHIQMFAFFDKSHLQ